MEFLPEGLEEFILSQFQTVTQVEVLCYFYNHRGIAFSASTLCHQLFLSETMISQTLAKLIGLGYVAEVDTYFKYIDENPAETKGFLKELVKLFETRKPLIVELLFNSFMKGEQ